LVLEAGALRDAVRRAVVAVGLEGPARRVKRALEPAATTRDRRDQDHLRAILAAALAPDANCVDVGANVGDVLADMVRLAPHGRHIAFEPLPALAADLGARFPAVDVRAVALGDADEPAEFVHVITRPGWSGLRERPYPGDERVERITVTLARLDDVLPDGYVPAFIKIDVEGGELDVLRGARRTLAAHRPLMAIEHGLGSADYFGARPHELHGLLTELGYRVFDLDGDGPFSVDAFVETFNAARRVNFLARP
jgi:FkbM family methyltransferase